MLELELTFSAGKTRSLESIFFAKQGRITRTSFVYKTSPLVRISLLISALNNRVMLFLSGNSYFIKVIENFFFSCVCISWYKHSRGWENYRPLSPSRILPTHNVFISGYANTENVFYCLSRLYKVLFPWNVSALIDRSKGLIHLMVSADQRTYLLFFLAEK